MLTLDLRMYLLSCERLLTVLYRGPIDTPMLRKSYEIRGGEVDYSWLPLGRSAHQNEVPPLIEFLLSDAASFITGNAMPIDGGWYC